MFGSTAIFVPAISLKKAEKASALEVDSIYFDLEDSIAVEQKAEARLNLPVILEKFAFGEKCLVVRINSVGTSFWEEDVGAFALHPQIQALLLPNADEKSVRALESRLDSLNSDKKIIALIETPLGLEEIREIARSSRMAAFQFGGEDYSTHMGITRTLEGEELNYARSRLANCARAYGLEAMDTPFTSILELEKLANDASRAKNMGFTGKAVIHPSHIGSVARAFRPSRQETEQARALLEAYERQSGEQAGVFTFNNFMVDAPVLQRARDLLKRASPAE